MVTLYSMNIVRKNDLAKITTPEYEQSFTHDLRGLVTQINSPFGQFDYGYDALMRRETMDYPNGTETTYTYDAIDRIIGQVSTGPFSANYQYAYDELSNITSWTGDGLDKTYGYNSRSQLTSYTGDMGPLNYIYDSMGNRTDRSGIYNEINELTEDTEFTFTYDIDGNVTDKKSKADGSGIQFTWNDRDQLIQLQEYDSGNIITNTVTYSYGPLGRRVSKSIDGASETYIYAGEDRVLTRDDLNVVTQQFMHGMGVDDPLVIDEGDEYFYHSNYLGSVVALSDATNTIQSYSYDPYGKTSASASIVDNPYQFTGRELDESGLYYYRSRYYDPSVSRFLARDPLGIFDNLNYYQYVAGNPTTLTDPTGEAFFVPFLVNTARTAGTAFAKCAAECKGFNTLVSGLTGCGHLAVPNCAKSCINPLNWSPAKSAKRAAQARKIHNQNKITKSSLHERGYKPKPGERTLDGYVSGATRNKEIGLNTNSPGFNHTGPEQFKRFGSGTHGGLSPHVHQPIRNLTTKGPRGTTGTKTKNNGVTSPGKKDVKQLYQHLNNGKY